MTQDPLSRDSLEMTRVIDQGAVLLLGVFLGCGGMQQHAGNPGDGALAETVPPSSAAGEAGAASPTPSPGPGPVPAPASDAAKESAPVLAEFVQERPEPVARLALDKPPHVAALGEKSVFIHDAKGWHEQALPKAVSAAADLEIELFYGRDYRVRIVGAYSSPDGERSVYLRSVPSGLKPAPGELGRLGSSTRGALVAVLGTADPEVVCRPGEVCLIKRVNGWTTLNAPAELSLAAVSHGSGWVVAGERVLRADREWMPLEPKGPWKQPNALFAVGERVFVTEASPPRVYELGDGAWKIHESPVGVVSSIWGLGPEAYWIAGDAGVAYFDGKAFRPVPAAPKGTRRILGRSEAEVWFAALSGLYRLSALKL